MLLLLLREIRPGLLANDVYEIAHRKVYINQVQSPIGLNLPTHHHITDDVIGARIRRIAVHRYLQIRTFLVRDALGCKQSRDTHKRRTDRLRRRHPWTRFRRRSVAASGGPKIRMQRATSTAQRRRVSARGDHAFFPYAAKSAVRRGRYVRTKRSVSDNTSSL